MPLRILLATFDGGGNVPPLVAVTRELVSRGHNVRVIGDVLAPGREESVREREAYSSAGAEVVFLHDDTVLDERALLAEAPPNAIAAAPFAIFAARSMAWARALPAEIDAYAPHVLLVDFLMSGAAFVAQARGLPHVVLLHTILGHRPLPGASFGGDGRLPSEQLVDERRRVESALSGLTLPRLNEARSYLGLTADDSPWVWEDAAGRLLVMTSPSFDFVPNPLPPNIRYTGVAYDPPPPDLTWDSPWPADDTRPLVVASCTTTGFSPVWVPAIKSIVEASRDLPVRVLLTIGAHLDPQRLPSADNVCIRDRVSHEAVFPHAAAVITQCGHATTTTALRYGLPMVCIPGFGDQADNAARVAFHGAGVRLPSRPSVDEVRAALVAVLGDASYRQAARRLGDAIARERGAHQAADEIEAVAAGR